MSGDPVHVERTIGTPADRFALEHAHYVEDLDHWRAIAREAGGDVLDLGAATGRVSLALARDGAHVTAVDHDPGMIERIALATTRERDLAGSVDAVVGDLRTLDLGRTFPAAILPMNTLQAFVAPEDRRAVLRTVRAHLAPGGLFAFDVVVADLAALADHVGEIIPGGVHRDPSGATLRHGARFDAVHPDTGTVRFTILIDEGGTRYEREHEVHLFSPSELMELLAEAGLRVLAVHGDFDGAPLDDMSERQIYRCEAA